MSYPDPLHFRLSHRTSDKYRISGYADSNHVGHFVGRRVCSAHASEAEVQLRRGKQLHDERPGATSDVFEREARCVPVSRTNVTREMVRNHMTVTRVVRSPARWRVRHRIYVNSGRCY